MTLVYRPELKDTLRVSRFSDDYIPWLFANGFCTAHAKGEWTRRCERRVDVPGEDELCNRHVGAAKASATREAKRTVAWQLRQERQAADRVTFEEQREALSRHGITVNGGSGDVILTRTETDRLIALLDKLREGMGS